MIVNQKDASPLQLAHQTTPLGLLKALRNELRDKLMRSEPDFRIYIALDQAIKEVTGSQSAPGAAARKPRVTGQRVLARELVAKANVPLSTAEIVGEMRKQGHGVSKSSLSSNLSQSSELQSVRYDGRACWWLADRRIPPEGRKT
ncbi:hypothetical protein [Alsobacter soli]|uniref:hypothetical protein n=1 Tax=Alsobacter soli TaxID=2109933 RepID=UPI0011B21C4B|nr:hypothetical protein [Alsobacter soli]